MVRVPAADLDGLHAVDDIECPRLTNGQRPCHRPSRCGTPGRMSNAPTTQLRETTRGPHANQPIHSRTVAVKAIAFHGYEDTFINHPVEMHLDLSRENAPVTISPNSMFVVKAYSVRLASRQQKAMAICHRRLHVHRPARPLASVVRALAGQIRMRALPASAGPRAASVSYAISLLVILLSRSTSMEHPRSAAQ